jgi:hypothetical protein
LKKEGIMKNKLILSTLMLIAVMLFGAATAHADGITIENGASLLLRNASMRLSCMDMDVLNGGTLNLGSGTIRQCGDLNIDGGATYVQGTGNVYFCSGFLPSIYLLLDLL